VGVAGFGAETGPQGGNLSPVLLGGWGGLGRNSEHLGQIGQSQRGAAQCRGTNGRRSERAWGGAGGAAGQEMGQGVFYTCSEQPGMVPGDRSADMMMAVRDEG